MAAEKIVTKEEVRAWAPQESAAVTDALIDDSIEAATNTIEQVTGRYFVERTGVVRYYDGSRSTGMYGDRLVLDPFLRPLASQGLVVKENGVTLTTAKGYSVSADVIIVNADQDAPVVLVKNDGSPWEPGTQNIEVNATVGFSAANMPEGIKAVCKELAWLIVKSGWRVGVASTAKGGASRSLVSDLSDASRRTLEAYKVWS